MFRKGTYVYESDCCKETAMHVVDDTQGQVIAKTQVM